MKKFLAILLAAVLLMGCLAGCGGGNDTPNTGDQPSGGQSSGGQSSGGQTGDGGSGDDNTTESPQIPEWLHPGSYPIVEEGTKKTLKIATIVGAGADEPENIWFYKYIEDVMNIDLEVEFFTADNQNEFIALLFADELPDIIVSSGYFTTQRLVQYGEKEGQILDLAPYINEVNTPNLYKIYQEHPDYKRAVVDTNGHVWSLGQIAEPNEKGQIPRAFINYKWLEDANLEVPQTLDDFTNMLREFKKRGSDIYPLGGGSNCLNPGIFLLDSLGYITTNGNGLGIGLRNGKVVMPAADREAWPEFLKLMNMYYTEGLIHPDFYTMDVNTVKALASSGTFGFIPEAPFVYFKTGFNDWWGAFPLTSDFNDTQMWPEGNSNKAGNFVVSADCENPELAMAFADWFFEIGDEYMYDNYQLSLNGPFADPALNEKFSNGKDIMYGLKGRILDTETGNMTFLDYEENPDSYASKNDYLTNKVHLWASGNLGYAGSTKIGYGHLDSAEDLSPLRDTFESGEVHFRTAMYDTLVPYVVAGYPPNVYFDQETSERLADIKTAFTTYIKSETAKFVTGVTPITEENLNKYFSDLETLGVYDYIQEYADYYDALLKQ